MGYLQTDSPLSKDVGTCNKAHVPCVTVAIIFGVERPHLVNSPININTVSLVVYKLQGLVLSLPIKHIMSNLLEAVHATDTP